MTQDQNLTQIPLAMTAPYNNQFLFSDHYLDYLLPRDSRWDAASDEASVFYIWLREMHAREGDHLDNYNESQLEDHWFIPIFERLGHIFERRASVPGLEKHIRQPDYVFFPTTSDRQAAAAIQNTDEYARHALAVAEVKQWDVHLSKKQRGGGSSFDRQNPSFQIDYYLKITGLTWGILSNGRTWRLVHHETSYRLDTYYEVDLLKLLEQDDPSASSGQVPAAIRYFYLFFRQAAFQPDAQGRVFLDDVLAGSAAYALALEEDLQENAYRALELLMQGFLDLQPNALTAADLRQVYDNSLYLLYRLLFILYGESRGLLPVSNRRYRDHYSLDTLKQWVVRIVDEGTFISRFSTLIWWRLQNLFHLINGDDPAFNEEISIARYNGGLFDPAEHPFLAAKAVGDRNLVDALDLLSRRTSESGVKEFVDYRTLNVRHLGSIYEGLLEYQPRLATAPMVAIRNGNGEQWMPKSEAPPDVKITARRQLGEVYLETDKGERKATGSYYTPQYIVAYIVAQTLGPLVEKWRGENGASLTDQNLVDAVLNLKVLDPAMGSGHFLVEATDYLARVLATDPDVEAEDAPDGAGGASESDLNHWRRRVVERCIYGVDKNPLAVELAKLSLWLATFATDKPLGFLDHHLKCGDSLVGATVDALGSAPSPVQNQRRNHRVAEGQMNMFAYLFSQRLPVVMSKVLEIVDQESDSYDTVRGKEAAHQAMQSLKAPFQAIADLWTSAHFGLTYTPGDYQEALNLLHAPDKLLALEAVQAAEMIAAEYRFLHWELTFPEVFFDLHGQPLPEGAWGFDAVIGNPPYGALQDKDFIMGNLLTTRENTELYVAFLEQALSLCKSQGRLGYIVPLTWQTGIHYSAIRQQLLKTTLVNLVNLPFDVFAEAYVDTGILILCQTSPVPQHTVATFTFPKQDKVDTLSDLEYVQVAQSVWLNAGVSIILDPITLGLIQSIKSAESRVLLGEITTSVRGILSNNPADIASHQPVPDWLPFFDGEMSRYFIDEADQYILFGENLAEKPASADVFHGIRLLIRRLVNRQDRLMCVVAETPFVVKKDIYVFKPTLESIHIYYLLAVLNSALLSFVYLSQDVAATKDDFRQVTLAGLRNLPIPRIDFTTPAEERAALVAQAIAHYEAALAASRWTVDVTEQPPDVIHDLLAHLAERMIALNRQKQQRVDAFTLDLEGVTDAVTFAKLQKGKQGRTLWKAAACRSHVGEDSHTTHRLEESLAWSEDAYKAFVKKLAGKITGLSDLVAVYRAHAPDYAALVQRIAATDRIIDQIVYQLYGLTDDEIAIVEA